MSFLLAPVCGQSTEHELTLIFEDPGARTYIIDDGQQEVEVVSQVGEPTEIRLDLEPGQYQLRWYLNQELVHVMDVCHQPNPRKLVFVSCDLLESRSYPKPWSAIAEKEPEAIVHMGDNVYCDTAYRQGTLEAYQERYRKTWKSWIKKLGGIPHYFGIDDHEVTDNIQVKDQDDPVIAIAMTAYDLYQTALTGTERVIKCGSMGRYWSKTWKVDDLPVQMIFMDRPTGGDAYRMSNLELVEEQTKMLILATSVVPFNVPYDGFILPLANRDEYSQESVIEFLDWVTNWESSDPERRVLIVSGDAHFGAIGHMGNVKVACSSPIANQALAGEYRCVNYLRNRTIEVGDHHITITRTTSARNYLTVEIKDHEFVLHQYEVGHLPNPVKLPKLIKWAAKSI